MYSEPDKRHKNMGPVFMNPFWEWDHTGAYLMTFRIRLDHEINERELRAAYEETLSVWPFLKDSFVAEEDGNIYFVENPNPVPIHHTEAVVAAGEGPNDNRVVALSYYGDTLTFTGMHSIFDGGSVLMLIRGTLCRYLRAHYNKDYDVGTLPAPGDGDRSENYEYYVQRADIAALPYEKKEVIWTTPDCYMDPAMKNPGETPLTGFRVKIGEDAFISYCKKYGSNPTVMFVILMAQTVYKMNQEEKRPFTGKITVNVRNSIGIPMAIMGQTTAMMIEISREELETRPLEDIVREKRAVMDAQRTRDYLLSRADDARHGKLFMQDNFTMQLSYFGEFNFGECTQHIRDILAYNGAYDEIHMFALNGKLCLDLQCGSVTERYTSALIQVLNEAGLKAEVSDISKSFQKVVREF